MMSQRERDHDVCLLFRFTQILYIYFKHNNNSKILNAFVNTRKKGGIPSPRQTNKQTNGIINGIWNNIIFVCIYIIYKHKQPEFCVRTESTSSLIVVPVSLFLLSVSFHSIPFIQQLSFFFFFRVRILVGLANEIFFTKSKRKRGQDCDVIFNLKKKRAHFEFFFFY